MFKILDKILFCIISIVNYNFFSRFKKTKIAKLNYSKIY